MNWFWVKDTTLFMQIHECFQLVVHKLVAAKQVLKRYHMHRFLGIGLVCILMTGMPDTALGGRQNPVSKIQLTLEERAWLDNNKDKLLLYFEIDFPPVEFGSPDMVFIGLSADVIAQLEKRLDIRFKKSAVSDWNIVLEKLKTGECAVSPAIVQTGEREEYILFTSAYTEIPAP